MGCDIHFVLESRPKNNTASEWIGLFSTGSPAPMMANGDRPGIVLLEERSYAFFGELAGVRRDGPPPNGIPEDASLLSRANIDRWGVDGHSHGHCSAYEFVSAWDRANGNKLLTEATAHRLAGGISHNPLYDLLGIYDDQYDDFRVVFWFDN